MPKFTHGKLASCSFPCQSLLMASLHHAASHAKVYSWQALCHAPSHAKVYSWQACAMQLRMPSFTHGKVVSCTLPCQTLLMASLHHAPSHAYVCSWQACIMHLSMPNFTHSKLASCTFPHLSLLMASLHYAPSHAKVYSGKLAPCIFPCPS